jgi:hypothetical protein
VARAGTSGSAGTTGQPEQDMPISPDTRRRIARSVTGILILLLLAVVVQHAVLVPELGARGVLIDFDAFYIVGQMFWEGRVAEAYRAAVMAEVQHALVGRDSFMPWTYPPQFDMIALLLPGLPRGLAYAVFTLGTLSAYLVLLARLSGPRFHWLLVALAPPISVTAAIGQNAFLTGALTALFCLATLRGRTAAGWPLGLLVIKPHLGIGLGVHALASARWWVLGIGVAIVIASSLLATLILGPGIWAAFLGGAEEAGRALRTEFYPLFRMTSVYAALHSLGIPPGPALWVQSGVGLAACGAIALGVRRGVAVHQTLAMACFTAALVSPYLYDYDMVVTGIGLALIAGDVAQRSTLPERLALLALIWVAGGWGMIHAVASAGLGWEDRAAVGRETLSYGAFAYALALLVLWRILRRAPH